MTLYVLVCVHSKRRREKDQECTGRMMGDLYLFSTKQEEGIMFCKNINIGNVSK